MEEEAGGITNEKTADDGEGRRKRSLPPPSSHQIDAQPSSPPGRYRMKRERGDNPRRRERGSPCFKIVPPAPSTWLPPPPQTAIASEEGLRREEREPLAPD